MDKTSLRRLRKLAKQRQAQIGREFRDGILPRHINTTPKYRAWLRGIGNELVRMGRLRYICSCLIRGKLDAQICGMPITDIRLLRFDPEYPYLGPIPEKWKQRYLDNPEKFARRRRRRGKTT